VEPHAPAWPFAVDTLQEWQPDEWGTWAVLGFARLTGDGLALTPVSLFNRAPLPDPIASPMLHLTLDPWQPAGSRPATPATAEPAGPGRENAQPVAADEPEEEVTPDDDATAPTDSAVGQLLATAAVAVERLAERGVSVAQVAAEEELHRLAERLRQLGVTVCADSLALLAARLAGRRHQVTPDHRAIARPLLGAAYVLHLALEQLVVADGLRRIDQGDAASPATAPTGVR
jgi:hypothetical protein